MSGSQVKRPTRDDRAEASASNDLVQAFVERAKRAATAIAQRMPRERLVQVVAAPTDTDALLMSMQEPAAIASGITLSGPDPLAAALLRGARIKRALLQDEGGVLSARELAEHLGITVAGLTKKRDRGQIFWLPVGQGYVYPAFQVGGDGLLAGVREVLDALPDRDPWVQVNFMLTGDARLEGARPLDVLRTGAIEAVLRAARAQGEDGS